MRDIYKLTAQRAMTAARKAHAARKSLNLSDEEATKWKRLLDPKKTSIKEFIESYKVPTKRPAFFGGQTLVPYREYPLQAMMRETVERQWAEGRGAKVICGAPRQDGKTKQSAFLLWNCFMRGGGGTWNLFSYDDDAVQEMFRFFVALRRQTPPAVFTHVMRGGGGRWVKSSAKAMELTFPDGGDNSLLQCLTAGDKHSGSGSSPRGLLWDEFSKWKDEVKADPSGMSEGWQSAPGNLWLIPSTGQGQDVFAEKFSRVWNGEDTESGFEAIFHPWYGHPDRTVVLTPEEEEKLRPLIGTQKLFGVAQERALLAAGVTLGELKWRRIKLAEMGYNLKLQAREYPVVPGDMFADNSRTVFAGFEDVLASHAVAAKDRERNAERGRLEWKDKTSLEFVADPSGGWTILERPDPTLWYCFGADSASGKATATESSGEPDFADATIDELATGRTCARYRGHTEGGDYAEEIFKAAIWYQGPDRAGAMGYIESNSFGYVTIGKLKEKEHGGILGEDLILKQTRDETRGFTTVSVADFGFWTGPETKEWLHDAIREYLAEVGLYVPGSETPLAHQFIVEAQLYERNPKTGKTGARRGKDDAVLSKALALVAREEIFKQGLVEMKTRARVRVVDPDAARKEFLLREARIASGLETVPAATYKHPRGGRSPGERDREDAEIPEMRGF